MIDKMNEHHTVCLWLFKELSSDGVSLILQEYWYFEQNRVDGKKEGIFYWICTGLILPYKPTYIKLLLNWMADDRLTDRLINAYLKLRNLYTSTSSINTGPRNKKKKRCRADAIWSGSSTVAIHRAKADNFSCALLMVRIFISKSSDAEIFICQT